jgi:hypothetical protein
MPLPALLFIASMAGMYAIGVPPKFEPLAMRDLVVVFSW